MSWERRLPTLAQEALDILSEAAQEGAKSASDGFCDEDDFSKPDFTKEEAKATLVANEEFADADAEYALELLECRAHIYYVDEGVYITLTDD